MRLSTFAYWVLMVLSVSFKFTDKKPIEELDLGRGKYKLGRKLYVYQF